MKYIKLFLLGVMFILSMFVANATVTFNHLISPLNGTNTSITTPQFSYNVSSTKDNPLLSCNLIIDGGLYGENASVNSSITYIIANNTISNGVHSWFISCTDTDGTVQSSQNMITIDTVNPTSSIYSPPTGTWTTDDTPEIFINLTDNLDSILNYNVFANEVSKGTGTANNNTPTSVNLTSLVNGTYTIVVEATDDAGNKINSSSITLYVDSAIPTSQITSPATGTWTNDTTPEIFINLTDKVDSTIDYIVFADETNKGSGTTNNNTITSVNLTSLAQGSHIIKVQATDNAGNSINSSSITLKVDTTAPTVTLYSPTNASNASDTSVLFVFKGVDALDANLNYTIYINSTLNSSGFVANNTNKTISLTFTNGNYYTWYVVFRDNATNSVTSGVNQFTVVDTTGPTSAPILVQNGVNDSDNDGNIEIGWVADINASTYKIYKASAEITNISLATLLKTLTGTSFEDNTTTNGTTYWYALVSVDSNNNPGSVISSSFSATANDTITPKLPTGVTAVTNADGSVGLSWTAAVLDVSGNADLNPTYWIYRTTNLSGLNTSATTERINTTTGISYTDTGIITATSYSYVITSVDDGAKQNTSKTSYANITPSACTSDYTYGDWGSCSHGEKSRTGTRTCYGGGATSTTQTEDCGSDSGSSGGGNMPTNPKSTQQWQQITPGAASIMKITNAEIGLKEIIINVNNKNNNVIITVQKLSGKPATVTKEIKGKVYKYLEIKTVNLDEASLSSSMLKFSVLKSWLTQQGINKENIELLRYKNNEWIILSTKVSKETDTEVEYEAETPGFSYFAIAEKETVITPVTEPTPIKEEPPVTETPPTEQPPVTQTTDTTPIKEETKRNLLLPILSVFALLIASVLLFLRRPKNRIDHIEKEISSLKETEVKHHHKKE